MGERKGMTGILAWKNEAINSEKSVFHNKIQVKTAASGQVSDAIIRHVIPSLILNSIISHFCQHDQKDQFS